MVDLNHDPGTCSVCGRSMLPGERTRAYVTRDNERREVCDLCLVRAENAGWVAAEMAGARAPAGAGDGRGAVRRLFGRARESAAALARPDGGDEAAEMAVREGATEARPAPQPRRRTRPAREPETGESEVPARRRSVPQNPERRMRRAFESFNASDHKRTVRGLIRSLGGPYVSAVTTSEEPGTVRITVAWEISWYQWEVDLTAAGQPVRELGHGEELAQLDAADQAWNAHAAEDGELRLGLIEEAG